MVLATRSWGHRCHIGHGKHREGHAYTDRQSSPDRTSGASVLKRNESASQGQHPCVTKYETVAEDGQEAEVAAQFLDL